jgi:hypothetical protein
MWDFSINDQVTWLGQYVGRVEYVLADGWAGVRGPDGRLDEYPADLLHRAR